MKEGASPLAVRRKAERARKKRAKEDGGSPPNDAATAVLPAEEAEAEEEQEPEFEAGERKKWERDLSQIRARVEGEFKPFTDLQWQIALRLLYGISVQAIVDELGVAPNTVARLKNMAKFEALAASFGKHHMVIAGYNARLELRRRTTNRKLREALSVKELVVLEKAAGVVAGPMQVKPSGPAVQIFLHPMGAAEAASNPTLAAMVIQALPAPVKEENGKSKVDN